MNQSSAPPPTLWASKPWWCQPWSIVLTGVVVPSAAWVLTHRLWIVVPIIAVILAWWTLFLYLVPNNYAAMVQAQATAMESEADAGTMATDQSPP